MIRQCKECGCETDDEHAFRPNRKTCRACQNYLQTIIALANRAVVDEYKNKPCRDCGGVFPTYVMDLHHRDASTKSFNISDTLGRHTKQDVIAELDKCDVLCSNCHRIRHYKAGWRGDKE